LIKIAIGLITSKLLAIFIGSSGMAVVGNFRNFMSGLESVSTLGFTNGIVKYIAENDKQKNSKLIATVFILLIFVISILSFGLFFSSNYWNTKIFGSNFQFQIIFKILAIILPLYAISLVLLAIINGLGKFKSVIYINTIGNIIGLFTSAILLFHYKVLGALLSLVIAPSILFFVCSYYLFKEINFIEIVKFKNFDSQIIKNLSQFSLMTLVSAIISPFVSIAIRNNIISNYGIEQAGFWETITRISSYYLLFITSILGIYYLPKLAVSKNNLETKTIFWDYYKTLIPIFMIGLICIYFLRFFIIKMLFTPEFVPVTSLFFWQLIGDLLKVCSWILAFNLLAKKHTLSYILIEIFSLFITYTSSIYFLQLFKLEGVVIAHCFTYLIYLIVLSIYFRKCLV